MTEDTQREMQATQPAQESNISHIVEPICLRWRIAGRRLPLLPRHIRSLQHLGLSLPLQAWVRSRIEWTIDNLAPELADSVLCLDIDPDETTTITVEPLRTTPVLSSGDLATHEGLIAGAMLEGQMLEGTVWVESFGEMTVVADGSKGAVCASAQELFSASDVFARDLLYTLGFEVLLKPVEAEKVACDKSSCLFLTSDEFGVVPIGSQSGAGLRRLQESFDKLFGC